MNICKVVGAVVSTIKDQRLSGFKLLLCQDLDVTLKPKGNLFVVVDTVGAGKDDLVLVIRGCPAEHVANAPVDAAIVSIVDSIEK